MGKSRELADLIGKTGTTEQVLSGRRNLIINGDMQVWQRGTSHTTAGGYQSVDRWMFNTYTGGAFTVSKETDAVHGPYLKWNRTSVDTAHPSAGNAIEQSIENARYIIGGKQVTLSFWLKDEAGLGSGFIRLRQAASPYADVTDGEQVWVSSSSDWEYHTFTFNVDSASAIGMDHVELLIRLDDGTATGGVSITKVQLELGSVATPFEHRSYGEELALCQRYFMNIGSIFTDNNAYSANAWVEYPVMDLSHMRASPSMTYTNTSVNSTNQNLRIYPPWPTSKILNAYHRASAASLDYVVQYDNVTLDSEL